MTNTVYCLQLNLVSLYENDNTTCSEISNHAFNTHALCYVTQGLCFLPPTDWIILFETIGIQNLIEIRPALKVGGIPIVIMNTIQVYNTNQKLYHIGSIVDSNCMCWALCVDYNIRFTLNWTMKINHLLWAICLENKIHL